MAQPLQTTGVSAQCAESGGRVACTADLTDEGTLRTMLQSTLSDLVASSHTEDPKLRDHVPAFVDAVILAASQCNQSNQMADVAHAIIESDLTPVKCALLITSSKTSRP